MCNSRITPSIEELRHLHIPLHDISMATNGFSGNNLIAQGAFGMVYKCVLEKHGLVAVKRLKRLDHGRGQGDYEFNTEIILLSKYEHENIVSLLGFCDEEGERILVYKYECNGSLDKHLYSKNLTWIQLLQICQDVARGIEHIHNNDGPQLGVFHRDVKSANILLGEKWNAKISDFGLSRVGPVNEESSFAISKVCGTLGYIAPEYYFNGYLTTKSDVYSFGVVLWEVLCGRHAVNLKYTDDRRSLVVLAQKHYKKGTLDSIIPSHLRKQIKPASLLKFANIAYQCLKNAEDRPTMKEVVNQLEDALRLQQSYRSSLSIEEVKQLQQIPLQDIRSATIECAYENVIDSREHKNGKLYHCISEKHGRIAIRRLDRGLGNLEFMTEIAYLAERKHGSVVPFLGHCDEGGEKIIVYKYPTIGSLYQRLDDIHFTYGKRLRIARDLASGIKYLDSDDIYHIINRPFDSSNIFLDEDMKPKVFDSGLSSLFPSNMRSHSVITNPWCTPGYNHPDGFSNGDLRQKSGVYSLGVVLWELLCGRRFTSDEDDPQSLLNLVREHYKNQTLHSIIPSYLFKQINTDSLITYSNIAYRCLNNEEERPTLREVEEQLQKALDQQILSDCSSHQVLHIYFVNQLSFNYILLLTRQQLTLM